jgi:hypothetical protein
MAIKIAKKIIRTNADVEMTPAPAKESKSANKTESKKDSKKESNKLPEDTYKDEIDPMELFIDEHNKFVFSVKRQGELGLPHVDIRLYVSSERYTGFTKKGINFPLEYLLTFIDKCNDLSDTCDEKWLE